MLKYWEPKAKRLTDAAEQEEKKQWWDKADDWLIKNMPYAKPSWQAAVFGPMATIAPWALKQTEKLSTVAGATLTYPFRKPPGEWLQGPFGTAGTREYMEWKGGEKEPYIPTPFPSPFTEENIRIGMGDIAETVPWMFTGGAGAATRLPVAGKMAGQITSKVTKRLLAREAVAVKPTAALADGEMTTALVKFQKPITEAKRLLGVGETKAPVVSTEIPGGSALLPAPVNMRTYPQLLEGHQIGTSKLLYNSVKEKWTQGGKRLMKAMTGKSSMKGMTEEEAGIFIESLKRLPAAVGNKPPKIPTTRAVITEELAAKIPMFQEIGFLERFRPTRYVFQKIGLRQEIYEASEWAAVGVAKEKTITRGILDGFRRQVKSVERREVVFDVLENPGKAINLTDDEVKITNWLKSFFDKWADDLKIPANMRRKNYITHIFDEATKQSLKSQNGIDAELVKAMDFITPKTINMPFLKQRFGRTAGLVKDPFHAAEVYENYALKQYYYQPLLSRIRVYEQYLQPNAAHYLREFTTRLTGRPLAIDREVNHTLKELSASLAKMGIPGAKALGNTVARGNASGLLAYNYTSLLYPAWLGFRPTSAIRNLSQQALAIADVGLPNYVRGLRMRLIPEGKAALGKSLILSTRSRAYLPGVDEAFQSKFMGGLKEASMAMFKKADKENVTNSFLAGYAKARSLGLPKEWAIKYGDEVAADTQYIYTQIGGAQWSQSAVGRVLSPLTTWPENFLELATKWASGRQSYVLKEYMRQTGTTIKLPTSALGKRKELMAYLSMVAAAYAIEGNTNVKATQYTGWSSLSSIAGMVGGDLPGLEIPGSMAEVVLGAMTGDATMVKQGLRTLRPDQFIVIARQLENVMLGKADWLSLFIYLDNSRKQEVPVFPETPGTSQQPPSGGTGWQRYSQSGKSSGNAGGTGWQKYSQSK